MAAENDNLKALSPKARASVYADGWMTVWEGAIRSGKTVASLLAWIRYVIRSTERVFFMSGKTYGSLIRNVIDGEFGLISLVHPYAELTKDATGGSVVKVAGKKIYLFGASDDSAYARLKGLTAGGWYADEVATHPESFIVEALSRTAVSTDRRIFWTMNPTVPSHYIYRKFTDVWHGMDGYRWYHFTLDDNLAMPAERKEELARQFKGRYRAMYIYGLRTAAEGVIYDGFSRETMVYSGTMDLSACRKYIACDYGTVNPCVFLECAYSDDGVVYVMREYRWDSRAEMSQKTDEQYVEDMIKFAGKPEESEHTIIVDPSAASFIAALKLAGYMVIDGKNDVLPGIRRVSSLFALNRIKIHESCRGLIEELEMYAWDEKAAERGEERPLKTNDHAPDALRYFCMTALSVYDLHFEE